MGTWHDQDRWTWRDDLAELQAYPWWLGPLVIIALILVLAGVAWATGGPS